MNSAAFTVVWVRVVVTRLLEYTMIFGISRTDIPLTVNLLYMYIDGFQPVERRIDKYYILYI